jgi:hypothetical protein
VILGAAVMLSGCYPREIVHTQRSIERELPDTRFRRQVAMSFGPVTMDVARWVTRKVDDPDARQVTSYAEDVDRIQFGVFETENLPDLSAIEMPKRLQRKLEDREWELAAAYREQDSRGWVLYRDDGEIVREMFVMVFAADELVLASLRGNLNDLMTKIVEDHRVIPELVK